MKSTSIAAAVLLLPTFPRRLIVVGFILLSLPLGLVSIVLTPPGAGSAAWWPAAGVAVLALVVSRGSRIPAALVLALVGVLSNYLAGRPLSVSLAFGLANAVEAWVICRIATDDNTSISLSSLSSALRFIIATVVGGLAVGILAGATVAATGGDFAPSLLSISASHASAVLVIVPLFLVPPSAFQVVRVAEFVLQWAAIVTVLSFVFWPGQSYPLAFLPYPILAWAAFRFRSGVVFVQSLVATIVTTLLTLAGGGPFDASATEEPLLALHVLQAFVIVLASTGIIISAGRNERERLTAGIAARESVLRSGIVASAGGIIVLEGDPSGRLRRAAFNDGAALLFSTANWKAGEVFLPYEVPVSIGTPFSHLVRGETTSWSGSVETDDERTLQVRMARVDDDASSFVLTIEVEDVTARRLAALADANILKNEKAAVDRLTDLNRQKDDFVASVSHELRSPVTSILGYSEELAALDLDDEGRTYLATITRNAKRLQTLIEDLLEVATASSTQSRPAPEEVDIDELLAYAAEDLAAKALARGVSLEISGGSAGGLLRTVRGDVERILTNIVTNAVKFTGERGSVLLSAKRDATMLHVRVVDTGVGIPAEDLENVFTRFFRSKTTEVVPGTGLGLPITKALVEGLGGSIHLFSDGSSGTEVLVSLPLEWPRLEL